MDDVIRIIKLLKNYVVLIDKVRETVKHETKRQESRFVAVIRKFECICKGKC